VQLIAKVGGNLFRALALHYPAVLVEHFCHGGADGVPILHLVFALEGDGARMVAGRKGVHLSGGAVRGVAMIVTTEVSPLRCIFSSCS